MTEPEQWAVELFRKAVYEYGGQSIPSETECYAARVIQRAFEERLHIELAKHSLAEHTTKATEAARARGYKIDPRLVDLEDRAWTATRQDAPVTENSHDH